MSVQTLADGVGALFSAGGFVWVSTAGDPGGSGVRAFDGQVLGSPDVFVRVDQRLPDPGERSLARTRMGHWCRVRVTCTGVATGQVRGLVDDVTDALEGLRPVAAGWSTSPLVLFNTREPVEDREAGTTSSGRYPIFAVVEFEFTATLT